jgi:hypothetical protein
MATPTPIPATRPPAKPTATPRAGSRVSSEKNVRRRAPALPSAPPIIPPMPAPCTQRLPSRRSRRVSARSDTETGRFQPSGSTINVSACRACTVPMYAYSGAVTRTRSPGRITTGSWADAVGNGTTRAREQASRPVLASTRISSPGTPSKRGRDGPDVKFGAVTPRSQPVHTRPRTAGKNGLPQQPRLASLLDMAAPRVPPCQRNRQPRAGPT